MRLNALETKASNNLTSRRHRASIAVAAATVGLAATLLTVPDAQAEPDITADEVRQAFSKVEAASERVNAVDEKIKTTKSDIEALRDDIARQRKDFDSKREELSATIVSQQMDQPLGPTMALLTSDDSAAFIEGLSSIEALNSRRADDLAAFVADAKKLKNRESRLSALQQDMKSDKTKAVKARAKIRKDYREVKDDYDQLRQAEQAEVDGGPQDGKGADNDTKVDSSSVKASGRVKDAIDFALSHVGDSYSWGGNGPNSWDCSGLTMAAFKKAGIDIGRVTYDQVKKGKEVPMSDVQPGDLVFFADLSHVGMYVGDGKVVNAARPGVGVVVSGLNGYSTARRIG